MAEERIYGQTMHGSVSSAHQGCCKVAEQYKNKKTKNKEPKPL